MFRVMVSVLLVMACSPVQPMSSAPRVVASPRVVSTAAATRPSTSPPLPVVETRHVISEDEKQLARTAISQALAAYAAGRFDDARANVALALSAMSRRLPDDISPDRIGALLEATTLSEDGHTMLLTQAESLLLADVDSGKAYGILVHALSTERSRPVLSPQGGLVAVPEGDDIVVYDVKRLAQVSRIAARPEAPFAFLDEHQLVTVRLGPESLYSPRVARDASRRLERQPTDVQRAATTATIQLPELADVEPPSRQRDDELIVIDVKSGTVKTALKLTEPPVRGGLRRVASLPPSEACQRNQDCERFAFDSTPIGRRVESLKIQAGIVAAVWHGGAVSIHRSGDGKLLGAFRPRGERWKSGLVAIALEPLRAAIATSLPEMGRGNEPAVSVTAIVDLKEGRLIELLDECRWATGLGFSPDGRTLMIGDYRRACLHDARTGRHLMTTEDIRPSFGNADAQEDVSVRPLRDGRWLLFTLDGAYGVFDSKSGRAQLRGSPKEREGFVVNGANTLYLRDLDLSATELMALGPSDRERSVLRADALDGQNLVGGEVSPESQLATKLVTVASQSCTIEGFRLPRELCGNEPRPSSAPVEEHSATSGELPSPAAR